MTKIYTINSQLHQAIKHV